MQERPLLAYFSHHKCGTDWTNSIIGAVCEQLGIKNATIPNAAAVNLNLAGYVQENRIKFLSYLNADYRYVEGLQDYAGFHVIRDPRDIVVSAYFSHLYSHPTGQWPQLEKYRENLREASKDEGLFLEMDHSKWVINLMYHWDYSLPNVLEIKFEDLIRDPEAKYTEIFRSLKCLDEDSYRTRPEFLHVLPGFLQHKFGHDAKASHPMRKMRPERLLSIVHDNRFSSKAKGRPPGQEDVKSHYRKGIPGDWVNHLSKAHKEYFKGRYNDVLVKLGYERGGDW